MTDGALPNLLIIGAAKSGTTALHAYLALHPEIFMSEEKELKLFSSPDWRERLDWYRAQFPTTLPVRGESSPMYSMDPWFPGVPARIREVAPEAKIVYLVRDPVERLVAQWVETNALLLEERPLGVALADYESPANTLVMASRYAHQLELYREHFPDEQILVLNQRALLEDRAGTLRRVFAFVGVDPDFEAGAFHELHNTRERKLRASRAGWFLYRRGLLLRLGEASRWLPDGLRERAKRIVTRPVSTPHLDPSLRRRLEDHLRPDAERLRALTGQAFADWSV